MICAKTTSSQVVFWYPCFDRKTIRWHVQSLGEGRDRKSILGPGSNTSGQTTGVIVPEWCSKGDSKTHQKCYQLLSRCKIRPHVAWKDSAQPAKYDRMPDLASRINCSARVKLKKSNTAARWSPAGLLWSPEACISGAQLAKKQLPQRCRCIFQTHWLWLCKSTASTSRVTGFRGNSTLSNQEQTDECCPYTIYNRVHRCYVCEYAAFLH